jgi:hypothetical protein
MNDDEARAQIGTHAMATMDLLEHEHVLEQVQAAVNTVSGTMQALIDDVGWTAEAATGFLIGVFLAARNDIRDGEGGT